VDYETSTRDVKEKGIRWQGTEEVIKYTVVRGVRHKLIGIEFAGNKYFDTELLQSRLLVFQGAFGSRGNSADGCSKRTGHPWKGCTGRTVFLDAKVDADIQDNYKKKKEICLSVLRSMKEYKREWPR